MARKKRHFNKRKKSSRLFVIALFVVVLCTAVISLTWALTRPESDFVPVSEPEFVKGTVIPSEQLVGQIVSLGVSGARYTPSVIRVKVDEPVTFVNDGSIRGCAMFVVQPELGIRANFAQNPTYTFTPTKKGKYALSCTMNMYTGIIEVI